MCVSLPLFCCCTLDYCPNCNGSCKSIIWSAIGHCSTKGEWEQKQVFELNWAQLPPSKLAKGTMTLALPRPSTSLERWNEERRNDRQPARFIRLNTYHLIKSRKLQISLSKTKTNDVWFVMLLKYKQKSNLAHMSKHQVAIKCNAQMVFELFKWEKEKKTFDRAVTCEQKQHLVSCFFLCLSFSIFLNIYVYVVTFVLCAQVYLCHVYQFSTAQSKDSGQSVE